MPCPKTVKNCPDRIYSSRNSAAPSKPVKIEAQTTLINGKKYTVKPKT